MVLPLEEYVQVVAENECTTEQVLPIVPATNCGSFITVEVARQGLRFSCREADPEAGS